MNKQTANQPELLAPAGNLNCASAAFQSGADAVYAGVSRFKAREMGDNFSWDDMSRLSAYTKKNNKRFYLTLNTLVKEKELEEFGRLVEKISNLKPDAVIIQDIGVARFLREYFPNIAIHGSTQMGIHNSAGVAAASDMGLERVILERQVTIEELRKICSTGTEIEVFIHGALCCSISGHCLFSSWLGGWSGNRGRCKQPCRRRYHGEEDGSKKSGFFFSTRDFYSLDMLDVLADAGVCSLKIEGRLKKPDYVKSVVSAYRMMLDTPSDLKAATLKEARAVLAGSYGRKWSHGFSTAEDMASLIQYDSAGASGRLAGSVEKTGRNGFEASVIQRLHIGDRIRIQPRSGDEGPSITITKMSRDRVSVKSATKGSSVFIHCDKDVSTRSMIYKIGESSAESVKRPADMPLYDPPLELSLKITASENGLDATASLPDGTELKWRDDETIDPAQNRPLEATTLEEAFAVTRNEQLQASSVKAEITAAADGPGLFIPAGRLKKTRRAFWEWLEKQTAVSEALENKVIDTDFWRENFIADRDSDIYADKKGKPAVFKPHDIKAGVKLPAERINVLDISSFIGGPSRSVTGADGIHELILPFFCPENSLGRLEQMIEEAAERGIRRFRVTSIYQFSLIR
ncbi:MAG TPA: peptidase U32, partial [Spirochaeta sp.]|nr:peptidase U32 [Spirochaeta sp.]